MKPGNKTCDKLRGERHDARRDKRLDERRYQRRDGEVLSSKPLRK